MPEFGIENLIQRARFERVRRGETNHMTTKITRHVCVAHFGQSAGGKRFISLFARVRRQTHELAVRQAINRGASFSVNRIGPEIHIADPVIQQLRRRNQHIIWRDDLHTMFHIEICGNDDFVVVTIERGMKLRIAIVRRIKKQIKDDQARTRPKEPIKQNRPDFAGPREWLRGHQLERSIPGDLFRRLPLPWEAGFLAGKCFLKYRQGGGAKTMPLPDFCSPRHGAERNGVVEKKWPRKINPVQKKQIDARTDNR